MSEITKKALGESLKKLSMKKELSKITIKNITDYCGVNRQTFYYHFKDIYDLIEWIYTNDIIKELKDNDTYESWSDGLLFIFNYILENKKFIINTYNSDGKDYLMNFLYTKTSQSIIRVIEQKTENVEITAENKKFIANFYKYAFVGIIKEWIENGMKEKPENIINKLNLMLKTSFEEAIESLKN